MERVKTVLRKIFPRRSDQSPESLKCDHVVTIEDIDGSIKTRVTKQSPPKPERTRRNSCTTRILVDILICCLTCMLWTCIFTVFIHMVVAPKVPKTDFNEYLFLSSFVVVMAVCFSSNQFESVLLKGFERLAPKVTIVVKQFKSRRHILRMRMAGVNEYIETEIEDTQLTHNDVLDICAKELKVEKDKISRLCKVPDTLIRSDEDCKRFRGTEYIEVHTC